MTAETILPLIERLTVFVDRKAVGLRQEFGVRWWSYRTLYQKVYQFAALLDMWEISPGARMLLWASNTPEWAAVLLGALIRGVVVVPVDQGASTQYVQKLVDTVRPAVLIHTPDQDVSYLHMAAHPIYDLFAEPQTQPVALPTISLDPDQEAMIIFTSGTTREPKGVILTHRNLASQINQFKSWRWWLRPFSFRMLALSPLSHVQGLMLGLLIPLSLGLSILYSHSVDPGHVMRTIKQNRATLLLAVPRVQHLLANALRHLPSGSGQQNLGQRVSKIKFFPLRRHFLFLGTHAQLGYSFWLLLVGGATLPPEDERFWYECGYVLVQGYGLTETTALASYKINGPFFARLGSIGKPLANQKIQLSPEGEILIKGDNVSPGYYPNKIPSESSFQNGFFHTGDLAELDEDKLLYFKGRKKDTIVTGEGLNVYPDDVEAILNTLDGVRDSVVFGLAKEHLPEVHAVLCLSGELKPSHLIFEANSILEPHQRIMSWTEWPEEDFPRTSLLKVQRETVIKRVEGVHCEPASKVERAGKSVPSLKDIQEMADRKQRLPALARYLVHAPTDSPDAEHLLLVEDLGLSSLDMVELMALVEKEKPYHLKGLPVTSNMTVNNLQTLIMKEQVQRPSNPLPTRPPRWASSLPGRAIRHVSQPLLINLWSRFSGQVTTFFESGIMQLTGPWIIAAAPHHNWLDGFVVYSALPRRNRRRLVTVTNRDFSEYFTPSPNIPSRIRYEVGLAYYLLWPLVFDFVIIPNFGSTREGLYQLGQIIERGYSPITFPKGLTPPDEENPQHEPGMAQIAIQTNLPILPMWLKGHHDLQVRPQKRPPQVTAWIGHPIQTNPSMSVTELIEQVEAAFSRLARLAEDKE